MSAGGREEVVANVFNPLFNHNLGLHCCSRSPAGEISMDVTKNVASINVKVDFVIQLDS